MIVLGKETQAERLEVMLWSAGKGPATSAVQRFVLRQRLTFGIALVTRGCQYQAAFRN